MLQTRLNEKELMQCVNRFNWTFKIADNIQYNIELIFRLLEDHNIKYRNYSKPISILCVSVIEAVFVDFLERLDGSTKQFPLLLEAKKLKIKKDLAAHYREFEIIQEGKKITCKRLKNFGFEELIHFYSMHNILSATSNFYSLLRNLGRFRNRVHIRNYFGNFERNESRTFSENRTQFAIKCMEDVIFKISDLYPRR